MKMTRRIQSAAIAADNRAMVLHADQFQVAKTKDQLVFESPPVCFFFFRYLFWTDWDEETKLEQSEMDGSNRRVIPTKY